MNASRRIADSVGLIARPCWPTVLLRAWVEKFSDGHCNLGDTPCSTKIKSYKRELTKGRGLNGSLKGARQCRTLTMWTLKENNWTQITCFRCQLLISFWSFAVVLLFCLIFDECDFSNMVVLHLSLTWHVHRVSMFQFGHWHDCRRPPHIRPQTGGREVVTWQAKTVFRNLRGSGKPQIGYLIGD